MRRAWIRSEDRSRYLFTLRPRRNAGTRRVSQRAAPQVTPYLVKVGTLVGRPPSREIARGVPYCELKKCFCKEGLPMHEKLLFPFVVWPTRVLLV